MAVFKTDLRHPVLDASRVTKSKLHNNERTVTKFPSPEKIDMPLALQRGRALFSIN
jgi:hypothetical protein